MDSKNFSIIGGDLRFLHIAEWFAENGYNVAVTGFEHNTTISKNIKVMNVAGAIGASQYIILPLPVSSDNVYINAPFSDEKIAIDLITANANPKQTFLGGKISDEVKQKFAIENLHIIDYLEREELAVFNAVPTAEGAIGIAMEELPITLHGAKALITGFGRIGKVLSKILQAMGCDVSVAARKCADLAWIKSLGYKPLDILKMSESLGRFDVIFNTVPAMVLGEHNLLKLKKNALVIDLASKPGGVDFDAAKRLNVNTIWALSLPGKVAPITSGNIIKDTILNILEEGEQCKI